MLYFAPSILSADFNILGEQIAETKKGGTTWVHFDVMDGAFVPNISFGIPVIRSIRRDPDLFLDAHLMIQEPQRMFRTFAESGADLITFHYEAVADPAACIAEIKALGKKAGMAIKPKTPVDAARPFMKDLDLLLIMTVEPGFGGQSYIPESTERIREARAYITEHGYQTDIQVDGGIKRNNVDVVLEAGANVIVAGSAAYEGDVYANTSEFVSHLNEWQKEHA